MRLLWWAKQAMGVSGAVALSLSSAWAGSPPAQKLPSALLVFPLIQVSEDQSQQITQDTRIELVNLSGDTQLLQCYFIDGTSCNEIGFMLVLTPYQPTAWLASSGLNSGSSAAPPIFGTGELKCAVQAPLPDLDFHNTIQGRATIFTLSNGQSASYGAVGFQRLSVGDYTGVFNLDGTNYAQCPGKLHFDVLTADQPTSSSEMVLVPCTENLLTQTPTSLGVQFLIYNEFESQFSTASTLKCFDQRPLTAIGAGSLTRAVLGTDTAHVIVRGSGGPLLGLVVDEVSFHGTASTAGNEPSFEGGSSATVTFP
ncbi:MAG: hypothetical protein ACHQ9S_14395 [Candidatus Binatia bacterium]